MGLHTFFTTYKIKKYNVSIFNDCVVALCYLKLGADWALLYQYNVIKL